MPNFRDVGGPPLPGGGRVRPGMLLRAAAPTDITDCGRRQLAQWGLRTLIDLRDETEVVSSPRRSFSGSRTMCCPIYRGRIDAKEAADLKSFYATVLRLCADAIAEAVTCIAAPGALPVLVHCSIGKDRTGIVIALVLSILGVPDQVIAEDYGLTEGAFADQRAVMMARAVEAGMSEELVASLVGSPPAAMEGMLQHIRDEYGGAEDYLVRAGVSSAAIATLQTSLS